MHVHAYFSANEHVIAAHDSADQLISRIQSVLHSVLSSSKMSWVVLYIGGKPKFVLTHGQLQRHELGRCSPNAFVWDICENQ